MKMYARLFLSFLFFSFSSSLIAYKNQSWCDQIRGFLYLKNHNNLLDESTSEGLPYYWNFCKRFMHSRWNLVVGAWAAIKKLWRPQSVPFYQPLWLHHIFNTYHNRSAWKIFRGNNWRNVWREKYAHPVQPLNTSKQSHVYQSMKAHISLDPGMAESTEMKRNEELCEQLKSSGDYCQEGEGKEKSGTQSIVTSDMLEMWFSQESRSHRFDEQDFTLLHNLSPNYIVFCAHFLRGRPFDSNILLPAKDLNEKKIIAGNYKIHLMPRNGDELKFIMGRLCVLAREGSFCESLACFKIFSTFNFTDNRKMMQEVLQKRSRDNAVLPIIVLYPHIGKENAQKVLTLVYEEFKTMRGLNITPRYNEKVTSLIYFAQGNGDEKGSTYASRHFEPIQQIYFKNDFEDENHQSDYYWLDNPQFERRFASIVRYLEKDTEDCCKLLQKIENFNIKKAYKGVTLAATARDLQTPRSYAFLRYCKEDQKIQEEKNLFPVARDDLDFSDFVTI